MMYKNDDIKFSVIVPVYNGEEYLEKCLESILCQTYVEFEIIIVNDGSIDKSGEICDYYATIDNRVKVIHQENKGLISARKEGIDNATGDFVVFVDADDWIEDNELDILKQIISINNVDIIEFGFFKEYDEQIIEERICALKEGMYVRNELWNKINDCIYNYPCFVRPVEVSLCTKAIRISLIKKVLNKIDLNITNGEDCVTTFALLHEINNLYVMHNCLYHYRVNNNSMTHKVCNKGNYELLRKQLIITHNEYKMINDIKYMNYVSIQEQFLIAPYYPIKKYIIPTFINKKVALFGKGVFSNNIQRICKQNNINIDIIIDSKDVYKIKEYDFDIIFVAITISSAVEKSVSILTECGVPKNKIKYITLNMLG